ncbi:MAG: TAT-variant-translocated molybdopterin oxidoreductase [Rhodanobacter sp.]
MSPLDQLGAQVASAGKITPPQLPAFDAQAARQRLADARGPVFWRSLEELSGDEGFQHWLRNQHPQLAQTLEMDRRGFLKLLGASLALAGLAACSSPPQTGIVPFVHGQPGQTGGLPRFFATTLTRRGYAQGVLVENNSGRPTKVEGNPQHPASLGATDIFAQAAVLQMWDPDRSQSVMHDKVNATWDDFGAAWLAFANRLHAGGGEGLRVLTGSVTSPTLSAQLDGLLEKYPGARWHVHEPAGPAQLAGAAIRLHLDRARVVLALDADFLLDPAAGVRYAHDYVATRAPESTGQKMGRLYAVEPTPSLTGSMADHHLALESHRLQGFARALAKRLGAGAATAADTSDVPAEARETRWLNALVAELQAQPGASLIVVGNTQPGWMHALGHAMNAALGNVGQTVEYIDAVEKSPGPDGTLAALVADMRAGAVDTLLVMQANPVYDAPADLAFDMALAHVPHLLHLGLYRDETGQRAEWHLPQAHALESWGDARAFDGTASIAQPLISPLYNGRSAHELLAMLVGDDLREGHALVRRQWQQKLPTEQAWNQALQAGVIAGTAVSVVGAPSFEVMAADVADAATGAGILELLFRPDPTIGDGRWANNGWLQELPKPMTQLTWDNAALISPALAEGQALANGDMVELQLDGRMLRVPVWIMPGQAAHSVTLHLGYGRSAAGHVGDGQGFNAYLLRSSVAPWNASGLQLRKTGERYPLAATQHHFNMEGRDLLRVGVLDDYLRDPSFAIKHDRYPEPPPSLYKDYPPGEYAWGMSIDLNSCIGCKACTIACQAENNIPVVGKDQVQRGREMHWIRVDRYFDGGVDDPRSYAQPVPCMMCEHAPCEVVCPVGATLHDSEGLNLQVYNRCVGTRFCSNNCPYKVRRFNFLQYADKTTETLKAQRNPEVSVRRRGVMEKCTYCIQRIANAHIQADKETRRIGDGEVVTACQAVCPTQAIRFGDISNRQSQVAQAKASPRNYAMLNELGTRPRTTYLARVRNPNPALQDDRA